VDSLGFVFLKVMGRHRQARVRDEMRYQDGSHRRTPYTRPQMFLKRPGASAA
jgi:hypothetical protein